MRAKLKAWITNIPNIPTMLAFRVLRRAIRNDRAYAEGWQSNIAMAVYDESRPQCICQYRCPEPIEWNGHDNDCAIVGAHDARHFEEHKLSHKFCNNAASRFMQICFGVEPRANV